MAPSTGAPRSPSQGHAREREGASLRDRLASLREKHTDAPSPEAAPEPPPADVLLSEAVDVVRAVFDVQDATSFLRIPEGWRNERTGELSDAPRLPNIPSAPNGDGVG